MATQTLTTPLYYGGHEYTTTATMRIMNPAKPSDLIGEAASATTNQALEAVAAAKAAFPDWAATPPKRRAEMLLAASETVMHNAETEAALLSGENGKVVGESTFDLMGLAQRTELACGLADQVDAVDTLPGPPPSAPPAITRAVQRMAEKLPAGVLNVVAVEDAQIDSALVSNTDVAKVCFTGSVNGGKRIMSMAAETLTNVLLELGGNDAVLVLQDADFTTENMAALFGGIYGSTGQICMNAKRIHVHASKKQELIDELTARLEQVKLGPASDPETTMGTLHQRSQLEYVNELVQEAKDSGAEVREFGELPTGAWAGGNFVRPSLIIDPDPALRVVTEEQFGPTIPIVSFDDVEEGIRMVNDTPYGLCNSCGPPMSKPPTRWVLDLRPATSSITPTAPRA